MNESKGEKKYGLVVVSAPSGAGKSTLCRHLLSAYGSKLALSISATSRAPRGQEKDGVDYLFFSAEEMKRRADAGHFAEWAQVHDNYYGTLRETLESFWAKKKHVLLDIDVQGAESLKVAYPNHCFTVFIAPPSEKELERRLRSRGTDAETSIQKRLANAKAEMERQNEFDLVIVNDDFDEASRSLEKAVESFMKQMEEGQWPVLP